MTRNQIDSSGTAVGRANPLGTVGEGIVYLAWDWGPNSDWSFSLRPGGGAYSVILHEMGHALGLAHPHDDGGGSSLFPGVTPGDDKDMGDHNLNQGIWTTMSYVDGWHDVDELSAASATYGLQSTPMALDIAAVQYLYGANMSYRTGNDIYTLPGSNGELTSYSCIWDAGGNDMITAGNTARNVIIDLHPAPLVGPNAGGYVSLALGVSGGFTIANGVTIENAAGGSGNDILVGNTAANILVGGAGNDTLLGGNGSDSLYGGDGKDTLKGQATPGQSEYDSLFGGRGEDIFVLGEASGIYYRGNAFATIRDWNAADDMIQVKGTASQYKLRYRNLGGSAALDTEILLNGDTIGVIRDNMNVQLSRDFVFV